MNDKLDAFKKRFDYLKEYSEDSIKTGPTENTGITEIDKSRDEIAVHLVKLLTDAVLKIVSELCQLPEKERKLAILFSGGVDSTTIAFLSDKINKEKSLKLNITLYTAAFSDGNTRTAPDLEAARRAAKSLKLKLCESIISLKETEDAVKDIIKIINSADPVKVGVALPFYFCAKRIIQGNHSNSETASITAHLIVISGLGSEEIFAGYQRHADVLKQKGYLSVNKECLNGLKQLWERYLLRDLQIALHFGIDLRSPFLDDELVRYSLKIPAEFKITCDEKKIILREAAVKLGLPEQFAQRKKVAAQYGSNFDKALEKLAKKAGMQKGEYLKSVVRNFQK